MMYISHVTNNLYSSGLQTITDNFNSKTRMFLYTVVNSECFVYDAVAHKVELLFEK